MPGSTPNSNILDALDELIKSINDLTNRPVIVQCGGCGCGGEQGINPPIPPETNGTQPPPTGYKPPVLVDNRLCKAAAYLYFQELEILQKLDQYDVPSLALGSITRTVALVTWILTGFGGGVGLSLAARLGTISEIVESFLNPIDLENLINGWVGCQDDIICTMLTLGGNPNSAEDIHNAIWVILEDYGVSLPNRIVYSNVFTIELIALLWYSDYDERFEQDFINWQIPPGVDCSCGCQLFDWTESAEGWTVELAGNGNTVSGEWSTDVLGVSISKSAATGADVSWIFEPVGWTVSTDDTITAELNVIQNNQCSGGNLGVLFDDNTSVVDYDLVDTTGIIVFSVTIPAQHDGKTISKIYLNVHDGDGCDSGQIVAEWSYCEVCLSGN